MTITKRFIFFTFFGLFYIAWIFRATWFYSKVDAFISNPWTAVLFSDLIKIMLWVMPAVFYITRLDQQDPRKVMRINTRVDLQGMKLAGVVTVLYFTGVFTTEYFLSHRTLRPLFESSLPHLLNVLFMMFISPFAEEFLFRGFVLPKLQETHRFWSANIWQSFLFTAMHWPFWIWSTGINTALLLLTVSLFAIGLLLGWITQRTNSIWPAIGVHILNNFLVSFLG